MAQDYLAIPGSSVPSERSFSSMRHIGTDFRNALSPRMFESLQILKDRYKHKIISASGEVKALPEAQVVPFSLASDLGALLTAV
jgi:hypothetical protein